MFAMNATETTNQMIASISEPARGEGQMALLRPEESAKLPPDGGAGFNRLIHERSPYLLQHARNPVDWYPWGEAAFAKARREDKPIFLSVGYSTCHWCHVMARESFADQETANLLNRHFIAIKVDREERPDIDKVYMTFVQATTGAGGWPMSAWLTPDLKPFLGGTYFPPGDSQGRPGFKTVLAGIADAWQHDRKRILASGDDVLRQLRQMVAAPATAGAVQPADDLLDQAYMMFKGTYDPQHGGFGGAPKFPRPATLNFLLRYHHARRKGEGSARVDAAQALAMTLHTLRAMADGGIHDHLGGGIHRYAVDERWHVPHFEKMLYDQAQLACAFLEAFQATRDPAFAEVARGILDYVRRDLTGEGGRLLSAEDADSPLPGDLAKHAEGAFYTWSAAEIQALLGEEPAAIFNCRYGVEPDGNVRNDPLGEFRGKNILIATRPIAEVAARFATTVERIRETLADAHRKLFAARQARPRPHLDDKTITAWNGLMISAFARAYQVLDDELCLAAATAAAQFLRRHLYREPDGILLRRYRAGEATIPGYADDYAFLVQGLLDLYEASFDVAHLKWASALQKKQDELFWDSHAGGYFDTTGKDQAILLRMKEFHDGTEPSASAVAALNLSRLAEMTDAAALRHRADRTLAAFGRHLSEMPYAMPQMLASLTCHRQRPRLVVIAGQPGAPDTRALLRALHQRFIPGQVILLADGGRGQETLGRHLEFIRTIAPVDGKAAAYVCENYTCQLPVTDPEAMLGALGE